MNTAQMAYPLFGIGRNAEWPFLNYPDEVKPSWVFDPIGFCKHKIFITSGSRADIGELEILSTTRNKEQIDYLVDEIDEYRSLPAGWDGYCDEAPYPQCLDAAQFFLRLLTPFPLPEVSVSGGEDIVLYWRNEEQYLAIKFNANNTLSYFYRSPKKEIGEKEVPFQPNKIPAAVKRHIKKIKN